MASWSSLSDRVLKATQSRFSHVTTYTRPGYASFAIIGVKEVAPKLDAFEQAGYTDVHYRLATFLESAPFASPPQKGDEVILNGYQYKVTAVHYDADGGVCLRLHGKAL